MGSEVCIELGVNVDRGRLPRCVLDHKEELGDDLDDMTGLEDEIALSHHGLGGQATGNIGLTLQLPRWRRLNTIEFKLLCQNIPVLTALTWNTAMSSK